LSKLSKNNKLQNYFTRNSRHIVYYTRKLRYFVQFFDFIPKILDGNGDKVPPSELKELYLASEDQKYATIAVLNANLFFWFMTIHSDVRNLNRREIDEFPCSLDNIDQGLMRELCRLSNELMIDFDNKSRTLKNDYGKHGVLHIQAFQPRLSKPIIDEIDHVLARHYGFTDEELDFIINYDIKYRMGKDAVEVEA